MSTMGRHIAGRTSSRPRSRERHVVRWSAVLVVLVLFPLTGMLVSCAPSQTVAAQTETTVTVIATASPTPPTDTVAFEPEVAPTMPGYRLVFNDEFIGPKLDTEKWATSLPWGNTNRAEQQYYTPTSLSQRDGVLTITARKQVTRGKPYSSGVISSSRTFTFKYGYVETRAKVPAGTGLWPAFWLPTTVAGSNHEIDVMEFIGSDPGKSHAVLHYGTPTQRKKIVGVYREADFSTAYHTFGVDWQPDSIVWYVDGVERYRVTQNVPNEPMSLIANLAVGGQSSWSGAPDRYTEFPAELKIDYIRVYETE